MSITRLYMDHKPGESLSLSAPELVHLSQQCVYGVGGERAFATCGAVWVLSLQVCLKDYG